MVSRAIPSERSELVFGLVAPVGTNLDVFQARIENELRAFGYETNVVRLSQFLALTETKSRDAGESKEGARFRMAMEAGTELRSRFGTRALVAKAVASVNALRRERVKSSGDSPELSETAHVFRSLKHPDEVRALRDIYGHGFFLIGIASDPDDRRKFLRSRGLTSEEIERCMVTDENEEGEDNGQRTRATFHLADVFVPEKVGPAHTSLGRFLELVFGYPAHTPTMDERNMFLAYAASLSSQALARQVGASIVSKSGELLAVGCNEVPKFGGGTYDCEDKPDGRDWAMGIDSSDIHRDRIIDEIVERLCPDVPAAERVEYGGRKLEGTRVSSLTEFGRQVHAEMAALVSVARNHGGVCGGTLYTTTYPCHNCAKHIIAAGLSGVVYIEPYPKSMALELHEDALELAAKARTRPNRVWFQPFVGVGPRRYFDLFSTHLSAGWEVRRKERPSGTRVFWDKKNAPPRVPISPMSYLELEEKSMVEVEAPVEDDDE